MPLQTADDFDGKRATYLFMTAKFAEANQQLAKGHSRSPYRHLFRSIFECFTTFMSFEPEMFSAADVALKRSMAKMEGERHAASLAENVAAFFGGSGVENLTREQRSIELVYRQIAILRAMLRILSCGESSIFVLIRQLVKIRSSYVAYKAMHYWLLRNSREREGDPDLFSLCAFGMGIFNILGSLVTPRLQQTCHAIGFDGDKDLAVSILESGVACDGVMSPLCKAVLTISYTYFGPIMEISLPVLNSAPDELVRQELETYGSGIYFAFIKGRHQMGQCRVREALRSLDEGVRLNTEFRAATFFLSWEKLMIELVLEDFAAAAATAEYLLRNSKWSPSFFAYAAGICHMAFGDLEKTARYFELAQSGRRKFVGKTVPVEKFILRKIHKYKAHTGLTVPHYELSIVWSTFKYLGRQDLQDVLRRLDADVTSPYYLDDLCLIKFVRCMCYKHLGQYAECSVLLEEILCTPLAHDLYLRPLSHAEYGHVLLLTQRYCEAERQFDRCLGCTGHSLVTFIQMRAYNYMNGLPRHAQAF